MVGKQEPLKNPRPGQRARNRGGNAQLDQQSNQDKLLIFHAFTLSGGAHSMLSS
jgi:hypothetical protein